MTNTAQINDAFSAYCHRAGYRPVAQFTGTGTDAIGEARIVSTRDKFVVEACIQVPPTPRGYGYAFIYPLGAATSPDQLIAHMNESNR